MLFQNGDKILFAGDSTTDAGRDRPVGFGKNGIADGYVRCVNSLLAATYPELNFQIYNQGNSGHTSRDMRGIWQEQVLNLQPDWVSVLIGINDVWRQFDMPGYPQFHVMPEEYEENLEWVIKETLPKVKGMILMTPFFIEPLKEDQMRKRTDEYSNIVKKLAQKYQTVFVDLQAAFDEYLKHRYSCSLTGDRVHPDNISCMIIAREFLRAVGFDRRYL